MATETLAAGTLLVIDHDELLGLNALAALGEAGDGAAAGPAAAARALMDTALAGKLAQAGLPWAPSAETVSRRTAPPGAPVPAPRRPVGPVLRRELAAALALAALVVVWGGYARGWAWTGFQASGQLWDWLSLLLLPVTIAVIPLWIQYRAYISRVRRAAYWAVIAGSAVFVTAGGPGCSCCSCRCCCRPSCSPRWSSGSPATRRTAPARPFRPPPVSAGIP